MGLRCGIIHSIILMEDVYEGEENVFWLIVRADEVLTPKNLVSSKKSSTFAAGFTCKTRVNIINNPT